MSEYLRRHVMKKVAYICMPMQLLDNDLKQQLFYHNVGFK